MHQISDNQWLTERSDKLIADSKQLRADSTVLKIAAEELKYRSQKILAKKKEW